MELLPKWNLHNNRPTFYDTDAVTMLELASKMHGAMNELIKEYNELSDGLSDTMAKRIKELDEAREVFETALRQEFQDFIDVTDLQVTTQEYRLDEKITDCLARLEAKTTECITRLEAKTAECEAALDAFIDEVTGAIDEVLSESY